jgi:hypothetical protein
MPILIVKVEMSSIRSKHDFERIKMPLNLKVLGGNMFWQKFEKIFQWFIGLKSFTKYIE